MNDTSCAWYLRVRYELVQLGTKPSLYNPALFYWHGHNELQGLITIHVGYICWGGTPLLAQHLIQPFQKIFEIDKECKSSFKYLRLSIDQIESYTTINHNNYCQSTEAIALSKGIMNQKEMAALKESTLLSWQINEKTIFHP